MSETNQTSVGVAGELANNTNLNMSNQTNTTAKKSANNTKSNMSNQNSANARGFAIKKATIMAKREAGDAYKQFQEMEKRNATPEQLAGIWDAGLEGRLKRKYIDELTDTPEKLKRLLDESRREKNAQRARNSANQEAEAARERKQKEAIANYKDLYKELTDEEKERLAFVYKVSNLPTTNSVDKTGINPDLVQVMVHVISIREEFAKQMKIMTDLRAKCLAISGFILKLIDPPPKNGKKRASYLEQPNNGMRSNWKSRYDFQNALGVSLPLQLNPDEDKEDKEFLTTGPKLQGYMERLKKYYDNFQSFIKAITTTKIDCSRLLPVVFTGKTSEGTDLYDDYQSIQPILKEIVPNYTYKKTGLMSGLFGRKQPGQNQMSVQNQTPVEKSTSSSWNPFSRKKGGKRTARNHRKQRKTRKHRK
jgi:hypothetical protein